MNRRELNNLRDLYYSDNFEDRALAEDILCHRISDDDFVQIVEFMYYKNGSFLRKPLSYRYKHIHHKNRRYDQRKREGKARSDKPPDE